MICQLPVSKKAPFSINNIHTYVNLEKEKDPTVEIVL